MSDMHLDAYLSWEMRCREIDGGFNSRRHHHPSLETQRSKFRAKEAGPGNSGGDFCTIRGSSWHLRQPSARDTLRDVFIDSFTMRSIRHRTGTHWGVKVFLSLFLFTKVGTAQFVEVLCEIKSEKIGGNQTTHTARCIFGTNSWLIEGDFSRNATTTWWCSGTNLISLIEITKEIPEGNSRRGPIAGRTPSVGEQFVQTHSPASYRPLGSGTVNLVWLAFCSGGFLSAEGRQVIPPIGSPGEKDPSGTSDKTLVFTDRLGLPKHIEIYTRDNQLICTYQVLVSTNYLGWIIPLQFELSHHRVGKFDRSYHASGKVISISASDELVVPDIMRRRTKS